MQSCITSDLIFLYLIVVVIHFGARELQNVTVWFWCDNQAVVYVVNRQTLQSPRVMVLVNAFVLQCFRINTLFLARHVPELQKQNSITDTILFSGGAFLRSGICSPAGPQTNATLALEPWVLRAQWIIWFALALSTRASYCSKVCEFLAFWLEVGLPDNHSVSSEHLMQFLLYLFDARLASRSLTIYAAAISYWSRTLGLADPAADFRVRKLLEGFKMSTPLPEARQMQAPHILSSLCSLFLILCSSPFEAALFQAMSIVMFFQGFSPKRVGLLFYI